MSSVFHVLFASAAPVVSWGAIFAAAVIGIFVLYVGVAILAVLRAPDTGHAEFRYRIFCDLLDLFHRGQKS